MRMALDLGLNRALEKLADGPQSSGGKKRTDEEERDLGTSLLPHSVKKPDIFY